LQSIPAEGLASSVAFGGGTLFLANSENAVLAAETPAPLNPLAAKSFGPMVRALKLAANDQVALVAEDSAGMAVLAPILTEPYVFVMFRITPDGDHTVTVQWRSEPGRTYTVHRSSNLRAGFTPVATGMAATPPLNTFRDTLGAGFAFYMVSIE
jgi:hypothetical protein